ncbi:MAG: hypothetical protein ABSC48_06965 [Terracidiphilus sp.]
MRNQQQTQTTVIHGGFSMVTLSSPARKLACLIVLIVLATGLAAAQSSISVSGGGTLQYTSIGPTYEECFLQVWSDVGSYNVSTYTPAGGGTPIPLNGPTSLSYVTNSTSNGAGSQYGDPMCTDSSTTETYPLPNLEAGYTCSLTATSSGGSLGAYLSCTPNVSSVSTTTTLYQSPSGSLDTDESYNVIAMVAPTSGSTTPTGSVTFTGPGIQQTVQLANGTATYSGTAPGTAGGFTITACYTPSTSAFSGSCASIGINVVINPNVATTTALFISPGGPLNPGESYYLYALVSPESGSVEPGGLVAFYINGVAQYYAALSGGIAYSQAFAPFSAGTISIYAEYIPSIGFSASQSPTQSVTIY